MYRLTFSTSCSPASPRPQLTKNRAESVSSHSVRSDLFITIRRKSASDFSLPNNQNLDEPFKSQNRHKEISMKTSLGELSNMNILLLLV